MIDQDEDDINVPKYTSEAQKKIFDTCMALAEFLVEKNKRYGNSALDPIRVFSKLDSEQGMLIRIDDKITRIYNNCDSPRKNDFVDMLGYIILLCVYRGWTDFSDLID
jgi:hypothetical protein